jgi:hypothetical protein
MGYSVEAQSLTVPYATFFGELASYLAALPFFGLAGLSLKGRRGDRHGPTAGAFSYQSRYCRSFA